MGPARPFAACTTAAGSSELHAVETLVDVRHIEQTPRHLLYDNAADVEWLREMLAHRDVALV